MMTEMGKIGKQAHCLYLFAGSKTKTASQLQLLIIYETSS